MADKCTKCEDAKHWEKQAKRLIAQNEILKTEALQYERIISQLIPLKVDDNFRAEDFWRVKDEIVTPKTVNAACQAYDNFCRTNNLQGSVFYEEGMRSAIVASLSQLITLRMLEAEKSRLTEHNRQV